MRKIRIALFISVIFCLFGTISYAAGTNNNFYYKQDGKTVYVNYYGTIDSISQNNENIIIAFYDNDVLIHSEFINKDKAISSFSMSQMIVSLPYEPANLKVKSFIWSDSDNYEPLTEAYDMSEIPADAIRFKGRVVNTYKTASSLEKGEVDVQVENDRDYPYIYIMNQGFTDAEDHFREFAEITAVMDEWGDYIITSYEPYTDGVITENLNDFNINNYQFSDDYEIYINGAEYWGEYDTINDILNWTKENNQYGGAKVKLIDESELGSNVIDGLYDIIIIDSYSYGIVDEVIYDSEIFTCYFKEYSNDMSSELKIYEQDEDISVTVHDRNGNVLGLDDIRKDDKLYIQYDVNNSFEYSEFYNIIIDDDRTSELKQIENKINSAKSGLYINATGSLCKLEGNLFIDSQGENNDISAEILCYNDDGKIYEKVYSIPSVMRNITFNMDMSNMDKIPNRAEIIIKDSNGNTILNDNIPVIEDNVKIVSGRIINTYKTNSLLLSSQVEIQIEDDRNFPVNKIVNYDVNNPVMYVYSNIIMNEKDGEYTIKKIIPKKEAKKFPTSLIVDDIYYSDELISSGLIPVYIDAQSSNFEVYKFSYDFKFFVNGIMIEDIDDYTAQKYLLENPNGNVTMVDETILGSTSTDGYYEDIFVDYFEDFTVENISDDNITLKKDDTVKCIPLNNERVINVFLNGEKTDLSAISEGDNVLVSYDVTADYFENSFFYDIYINR